MADTSTSRPRPRPKPKVVPKPVATQNAESANASASSALQGGIISVIDGDEMFIRNRTRTSKAWQQLEEINKEKKSHVVSSDNDSEGERSPRSRRKKKKTTQAAPRWQKDKDLVRLLSVDLSDDSTSDEVQILGSTISKNIAGKRKRQRSKSRSITPPPALPIHQIQNARNLVRQTLETAPRHASPTNYDFDASTDTIILDPELERLAKTIASQPQIMSTAQHQHSGQSTEVIISVKWQPHPLNEAGKTDTWVFKMNRDDNFRELFEATAEEASILIESLIMSYNGKRIFSSVSPQTLKMWDEAELIACDKMTFDYLRTHPNAAANALEIDSSSQAIEILSDDDAPGPGPSSQAQHESDAESEPDGDKFKLILRSGITKDISLVVRPTTKCGAIIKAYLKKAGVADQYPQVFGTISAKRGKSKAATPPKDPRICVDGDKLNNDAEISEADLEDGDMVEVVGL